MHLLQQLMMALAIMVQAYPDGAAGETVTVKRGDNVTLTCVDIGNGEQLQSLFWYKEDILQAQVSSKKEASFVDPALAKRKSISSEDYSLMLWDLEVGDTAVYSCQVFVLNVSRMENHSMVWDVVVQDVPSPPGKPDVMEVESQKATLSWSASTQDNNSPISNYIVQLSECDNSTATRELVTGGSTLQIKIPDLKPETCYEVQVLAQNSVGQSLPGLDTAVINTRAEGDITTAGSPAGAPESFQAVSTSSSDIRLTWQPPAPESLRGKIEGYKVTFSKEDSDTQTVPVNDPTTTELTLHGLSPFTLYTVSILAYNEEGDGPKAVKAVMTLQGVPSSPRITHITGRQATSFYVHWEPPNMPNGHLVSYELHWILNDVTKTRIISGLLTNPMSAFISALRPYTEYKVQVAAFTEAGQGNFSEKYPALTDVAAPSAPYIRNVTVLSPSSVRLHWDPPTIYYRRVDSYVLKWWDNHGNDPDTTVSGTRTEYTLRNLPSNRRYSLKMAGVTKAIFSKRILVGAFTDPVSFTLGVESLEKNNVIWDNFGNNNDDPKFAESKEEEVPKEIIAGVTCAIVVMLIIVVMFIGYRSLACQKCYQAAYFYLAVPSQLQSTPPTVVTVAEPSEEKEYPDIPVSEFPAHVEAMHADSDIAFAQEFEDLSRNTRTDFTCEASNVPENRAKNRYINIAAFDHSRVVLKVDSGRQKQPDYINANYVDGYQKHKAYIATQGPLPQTFPDFWRMVWEQNCSVIVMITNLMEKGRRKCDQYWPSDVSEVYGNISVKLVSSVQRAHFTVRTFNLRNTKRHSVKGTMERTVYQYHYTEWPDHGVPDYTLPVLEFVQKSAACNPQDGGPIIVHCSAGVGRTGTYILIDSMIRQIADKGTVNIPGFTLHIRRQRNLLVQTEDQYIFIHDVLVEYLMGGGQTEVRDEHIISYLAAPAVSTNGVASLHGQVPSSWSILEKQFKMVTVDTPREVDMSCALRPVNVEKNRSGALLPVNLKRVLLPARPGVEGSEYINATYLHGYRKSDEFIVTQYPVDLTKEDFWRMVWDRNSPVIIVLLSADDEEEPSFWPEKGQMVEVDAGNFKLSMRDDPEQQPDYTTRDFILESMQYDYIFMTKVVTVRYWPDTFPVHHSVFSMVDTAIDWQRANDSGPVIVMDRLGGPRSGRFCALWTLRDQLILDKVVDVYQLVKLYHLKRPGIVSSQDDLRFLYEALACLKEHLQDEGSAGSSSPLHPNPPHSPVHKNGTLPRSSTLQSPTTTTPSTKIDVDI
ncbi:putative receptor-type tyrosine-protein phosphatase mosPTP-1 [Babylonia areolata]|uniref:putative receptor-type tyrosine-protein phosphatase mosPTP-1 n=1 Tax=Babylonia areolata TaxID=304850 RepID=UPI003FD623F7